MINKQNLWFFTLLSLIVVLGIYYVTMPNELLQKATLKEKVTTKDEVKEVKEENTLMAMRINLEDQREEEMSTLTKQLTSEKITSTEKNNIYEQLKYLNEIQGKEETLEKKIKKELELYCFIKIDNKDITTVCISDNHDVNLANKINNNIQKDYKDKMNITVKFQRK